MRNVMRKTLVAVGITVALAVGPGVGLANAAPLQIPTQQAVLPPDPLPVKDVFTGINELVAQVVGVPSGLVPEVPALPV